MISLAFKVKEEEKGMEFNLNKRDDGMTEFVAIPDSKCPACGDFPDYCQGHGEIGDPVGYGILEMHETDNHTSCRFGECVPVSDETDRAGNRYLGSVWENMDNDEKRETISDIEEQARIYGISRLDADAAALLDAYRNNG